MIGYRKEQFEEKFSELEQLNKDTDEHFFKYMKMILSFGRATIITERGVEEGKELYKKWKNGEKLTREENMMCGFLLSDISILEEDVAMIKDLQKIYNEMVTTHKPDFGYLQSFGKEKLVALGYSEPNPRFMETIEQMFVNDHVINNPEQINMINSGEMPIYIKDIKVCPYCAKQFGDNAEDLFKHVKAEHGKK